MNQFIMVSREAIINQLKTIFDPEIPVNIYDLGLIYGIDINETGVKIQMTLTTATCPAAAFISEEVREAVLRIRDLKDVEVDVVFEPRWSRDRMNQDAREVLGW